MGCFSCIRCSCGGNCMGCSSCSTCSCGGKCIGCSSCIACSCGGKCIGCSSCSGCSDGGKCMGCFCCCKPSNEAKDPSRRRKKWNPLSCLACKGKKIMGCSCCHKSGHEEKEPSTRPEKKEKEGEKGTKGCLCFGKCWCESKKGRPSGVVEERKEKKKGTSCLVCRGERTLCCSCCGKSSDENKKPPKKKKKDKDKEMEKEKDKQKEKEKEKEKDKQKEKEKEKVKEKEQKERKKRSRKSCLVCRGKGLRCCLCCAKSSNEDSKKKKKKREPRKGSSLAFLVHNISFKSDSGKHRSAASEILRIGNGNIAARMFQFQELAAATENFKSECLLGEGGFGRVYRGNFKDTNQVVAVKQLDRNGFQGNREFLVEVLMLSLLHHPNLVNLLGYCADGDQRILVYEYMPLGSLEDHLLARSPNRKPLDWNARMKIALGAAKGIEYLHDIANPPVIYRDLKASNILLDEEYNPKLSDFGLAKLGPVGDKTHVSTRVMGTYGYCAPEYALTGKLTKMSDVYSFGVVFLEIITGRRAIDITRPTHEQHLVQWAGPLFKDKSKFPEMADPLLQGKYPLKGMYQALAVAAMCLQEEATIRPRMSDVVTALEYLSVPSDFSTEGSKEFIHRESLSPSLELERSTNGNEGKPQEEGCNSTRELEEDVDVNVHDTRDHGNT